MTTDAAQRVTSRAQRRALSSVTDLLLLLLQSNLSSRAACRIHSPCVHPSPEFCSMTSCSRLHLHSGWHLGRYTHVNIPMSRHHELRHKWTDSGTKRIWEGKDVPMANKAAWCQRWAEDTGGSEDLMLSKKPAHLCHLCSSP